MRVRWQTKTGGPCAIPEEEEEEAETTQSESTGVTSRFLLQTGSGTGLLGSTLKSADVRSSWRQSLVTDDPGLRPE